ncbi:MAG: S8 family serine peptidase [Lachnospiraceae bacterium]|nr:S8 family serine peptidase [Lachnospiraceae bacterium]
MKYGKVRRILPALLTMTMLAGQAPQALAYEGETVECVEEEEEKDPSTAQSDDCYARDDKEGTADDCYARDDKEGADDADFEEDEKEDSSTASADADYARNDNEAETDAEKDEEEFSEETDEAEEAVEAEEEEDPSTASAGADDPRDDNGDTEDADSDKGVEDDDTYELSAFQKKYRAELESKGVFDRAESVENGIDIVGDRLFFMAEDKAEAEEVAAVFDGELISFEDGTGLMKVEDAAESFFLSAFDDSLPGVEPDYILDFGGLSAVGSGEAVPVPKDWSDWYNGDEDSDPFLNPADSRYQWMHDAVKSYSAWGVTTGSEGVKVVIIGSGVDADHPELAGKESGKVEANMVEGVRSVSDCNGSGTAAASIIAGALGNGEGGAGIAPGVSLLSIRVIDDEGKSTTEGIKSAISMARTVKADIIVFPDVWYGYSNVIEDELKAAKDAKILVIAGAGDNSGNSAAYPGSYDSVMAVAATDESGKRAPFSGYGSHVDIAAPGADIYTAGLDDGYSNFNGSGYAASVVAGAAALYLSSEGKGSDYTADTLKKALKAAAVSNGESGMGSGVISCAKLFEGDTRSPKISLVSGLGYTLSEVENGESLTVSFTVPEDSYIFLKPAGEGTSSGSRVIYTVNGKTPSVKNGVTVNGDVYDGEGIAVKELLGDSKKNKKVTVKAATVTGMGVLGKPATMIITIEPGLISKEAGISIINAPMDMGENDVIQLEAEINGTTYGKLKWAFQTKSGVDATLDENKGILTAGKVTAAKGWGVVRVYCYIDGPKINGKVMESAPVEIMVIRGTSNAKVKTMTLKGDDSVTLGFSENSETETYTLSLNEVFDDNNTPLLVPGRPLGVSVAWRSSNESVVTVTAMDDGSYAVVKAVGPGTAKVTCGALDGSKKSVSCTFKVNQMIDSIKISGQEYVRANTTSTYKAEFTPSNVGTKKVVWTISENVSWAEIDPTSGKLKVVKSPAESDYGTTITICASSGDGSKTEGCKKVMLIRDKVTEVRIDTAQEKVDALYGITRNNKNKITAIRLFTKVTGGGVSAGSIALKGSCYAGSKLMDFGCIYTSSNEKVAKVDENGVVTAVAKGTATITCKAADGSNKKATVKVKVHEPVDSITVGGQSAIASGKSATFKASQVLPSTAGNKKVTWRVEGQGATINEKTGKVTVYGSSGVVTVIATAADGSGITGSMDFIITSSKSTKVTMDTPDTDNVYQITRQKEKLKSVRLFTVDAYSTEAPDNEIELEADGLYTAGLWKSSNDKIAEVVPSEDGLSATVKAKAAGKVTISCTAQDGTKKKASVTVNVQVPVSGVKLIPQDGQTGEYHYLGYGCSADIKASMLESYGKAANRDAEWSLEIKDVFPVYTDGKLTGFELKDNPKSKDLAKIKSFVSLSNGKLTLCSKKDVTAVSSLLNGSDVDRYAAAFVVTAAAKDGSEAKASITYIAAPAVKDLQSIKGEKIDIYLGTESLPVMGANECSNGKAEAVLAGVSIQIADPTVASAVYNEKTGCIDIYPMYREKGSKTTAMTVTARDGSKKSETIQVTITNTK